MNNMSKDKISRKQKLELKYIQGEKLSNQEEAELKELQKESATGFSGKVNTSFVNSTEGYLPDIVTKDINRMYFLAEKMSADGLLEGKEMEEYKKLVHRYEDSSSFPPEIRALNIMLGI